ncbi:MAG: hypothetical protein XU13_C0039G0018 [Candidatus Rokubacteria bacterium CSP1-6]|nr:MAG: hypothetical protein XU13_C0039G0018 [Candidatus Rokubacteria bacterium CSP1-6]
MDPARPVAEALVLDRNPLEVSPEELPRLKVLRTFVAGQEVSS